jgi:hypothetical protein
VGLPVNLIIARQQFGNAETENYWRGRLLCDCVVSKESRRSFFPELLFGPISVTHVNISV